MQDSAIHQAPATRREPFQTMQEVDRYLSGDSIECLICGRSFQLLTTNHLLRAHGINGRQYRLRFGIPLGRGLSSAPRRARFRARITPEWLAKILNARLSAPVPSRRPTGAKPPLVPAVRNLRREIFLKNRKALSPHRPTLTRCIDCGAEFVTSAYYASHDPRCVNCISPEARQIRLYYQACTALPPLTGDQLASFQTPFQTMLEVWNYVRRPAIPCLICGRHFVRLSTHIKSVHELTHESYCWQFGIPEGLELRGQLARPRPRRAKAGALDQSTQPQPTN